jgi:hypothetical protein
MEITKSDSSSLRFSLFLLLVCPWRSLSKPSLPRIDGVPRKIKRLERRAERALESVHI